MFVGGKILKKNNSGVKIKFYINFIIFLVGTFLRIMFFKVQRCSALITSDGWVEFDGSRHQLVD